MRDPIVEEIRRIRQEIYESVDCDDEKYIKRLKELEKKYADRLVSREPKTLPKPKAS